jgi:hypothetical protein
VTGRVLHEIPPSWVREKRDNFLVLRVPMTAMVDVDASISTIRDGDMLGDWRWVGCTGQQWQEFLTATGDKTARQRAEKRSAAKLMESKMKADFQTPQPRACVVGSVVAPAAIAGHPLACVRRKADALPVRRFWINLWAACSESADSFFGRMTAQLAEAVAASRRQPVEVVAYAGGRVSRAAMGCHNVLFYTVVSVGLHDWNKLGAVLHPAWLRRGFIGVHGIATEQKWVAESMHADGQDGLRYLERWGIDPNTYKP